MAANSLRFPRRRGVGKPHLPPSRHGVSLETSRPILGRKPRDMFVLLHRVRKKARRIGGEGRAKEGALAGGPAQWHCDARLFPEGRVSFTRRLASLKRERRGEGRGRRRRAGPSLGGGGSLTSTFAFDPLRSRGAGGGPDSSCDAIGTASYRARPGSAPPPLNRSCVAEISVQRFPC